MASYLAWYGKKRQRLVEHEREFAALLQKETDVARLAGSVEMVRAAQVRALKAIRGRLSPSEKNAVAVANLDREIRFWLGLSVEEVIEGYRTGKLRGLRAAAARRASK
jgi:hypothetical protein